MQKKIRNHFLKIGTKYFDLKQVKIEELGFKKPCEFLILNSMLSENESIVDLSYDVNYSKFLILAEKFKIIHGLEVSQNVNIKEFYNTLMDYMKKFEYDSFTWEEIGLGIEININPTVRLLDGEILKIIEKTTKHLTVDFIALILAKYDNSKKLIKSVLENYARMSIL